MTGRITQQELNSGLKVELDKINNHLEAMIHEEEVHGFRVLPDGQLEYFDGHGWIPISIPSGIMPPVTEFYNGLMSKEDFIKLLNIKPEANYKIGSFVEPDTVLQGVIGGHLTLLLTGEIVEVKALCSRTGYADTLLKLEKSVDMINWFPISDSPIRIPNGGHLDDGSSTLLNNRIEANEILRLNVIQSGEPKNLTVPIKIKLI
jgi:hypothetical protein